MIDFLLRARFVLLLLAVFALAGLALFGLSITYDQSIESFFAEDDPTVQAYRRAAEMFGNDQVVFVSYDDPELLSPEGIRRVEGLSRAIRNAGIEGILGVESLDQVPLFWQLDDALFTLAGKPRLARTLALNLIRRGLSSGGVGQSAIPTVGQALQSFKDQEFVELKSKITTHPLMAGSLVDRTGKTTALLVRLKSAGEHDAKATISGLRTVVDRFAEQNGLGRPAVVGPPVLLADGFIAIEADGRRLSLAGMLLIGLVTLTATRSVWWALVPICAGWLVWLATETVVAALGLKLSLSGGPLVAQIIVLTMPAASHLALHFREDVRRMTSRREAAIETFSTVSSPVLWCAVAATLGYGALLSSNVVPVRQFGSILAIATASAAFLTLALSTIAMIPPFRLEVPVVPGSISKTGVAMNWLTAWVDRHPGLIVVGTLAIVLPLASGMTRLRYESNYINAFKPETRVAQDYYRVESRLGGIGLFGVSMPLGTTLDPEILAKIREADRGIEALRRADGQPAVNNVLSLHKVLDPEDRLQGLKEEEQSWLIQTKLELVGGSAQASLLRNFYNQELGRGRTLLRLSEQQEAEAKEETFERALGAVRSQFGKDVELAGLSKLLTETTRGVVETQWTTFAWAVAGILLALTLAFRDARLALLALLPTILAVGLVLGLMGWLGLKLDIATALVASVALGLSVDDTFHCLLNFQRIRRHHSFRVALFEAYKVSGPGVLLSSLAVATGFAVLRLSEFVPFSTFGTMVCIATAGSTIGNLLLLPACLRLSHRFSHWDDQAGRDAAEGLGAHVHG